MAFAKNIVVGCGFWGAVIAERIANLCGEHVTVIDSKCHAGGHSYSRADRETGIECHLYGSHIFHTSLKEVHEYITNFCSLSRYVHKVYTMHGSMVFQMPINLSTINSFYGINLMPCEVADFIRLEAASANIKSPGNLEEKAISIIGVPLYEAFIKGYTKKQWRMEPRDLPEFIINRLPVRANYNNDYFADKWQGLPQEGYGKLFDKMLAHPKIELRLNVDFDHIRNSLGDDTQIFYSGAIDDYFYKKHGSLEWRSLEFQWEVKDVPDWQGTSVMNYADEDVEWTRIHEFRHLHPERTYDTPKTVICKELPAPWRDGMNRYYPVNIPRNDAIFRRYAEEAACLKNVFFGGRLGSYRYMDMDKTIAQALEVFRLWKNERYSG